MIDIVTFKKSIENNTLLLDNDSVYICIGKDITSEFVFDQYVHTFADNNSLDIVYVDDLVSDTSFFGTVETDLKVYKTDKLEDVATTFVGWIYCRSMDKNVKSTFNNIVEIPKLEKWQIIDYISTKNSIDVNQAEKLYKEYNDIYKLDIEASKLGLFEQPQFNELSDQLFFRPDYQIFDLTNAILQRDVNRLKVYYQQNVDIDTFAFMALLLKNFKQVIDVQLSKNASAESLGISGKQFWAIKKYNCYKYTQAELVYIYKLLTSIDLRIKTGQIDVSTVKDYVIFSIISLWER